jgi:anhydro-N-acetylmuramic acid kinase
MSGTSADGIDAAVVRLGAAGVVKVLAHHHEDFESGFRARILGLPRAVAAEVALLHVELGRRFADAALAALDRAGVRASDVAAIASPGLTAVHLPPSAAGDGATLALGDGDVIAARTGCPVISDFRAADRAAGGHGAPLVPWADARLLRRPGLVRAALNVGGIANITVVPPQGDPVAFDTGPGNMLLDGALARATGGAMTFDRDGALGLAGRVDDEWLEEIVDADEFLRQPPPRSTGRERYGEPFLERHAVRLQRMRPEDVAATLAAYTVEAVVLALELFVRQRPAELIVSGGGAKNRCLMQGLRLRLPGVDVSDSDSALDIPALAKEAVAFALIGDATLRGEPGNVPSVTGARRAVVLGKVSAGQATA